MSSKGVEWVRARCRIRCAKGLSRSFGPHLPSGIKTLTIIVSRGRQPAPDTTKGSMSSSRSVQLRFFAAAIVAALALAVSVSTKAGNDNRTPEVPAILQVTNGDKVHFHAYAVGVQIYVCTQSATDPTVFTWTFRAPEAVLFD